MKLNFSNYETDNYTLGISRQGEDYYILNKQTGIIEFRDPALGYILSIMLDMQEDLETYTEKFVTKRMRGK